MIGHLVFNDYDFGELFFCHAPKRLMPSVDVSSQSVSGRSGAYFKSRRYEPIEIECTLVLRGPKGSDEAMITLLEEVAQRLDVDQAKLYLPTDDSKYYLATLSGASSVDEFVTSARLRLTFTVLDPFKRGQRRSVSLSANSATYVEVGGTYPASPIITAQPVANTTMYRWRDYDNDKSVYVYADPSNTSAKWNGTETIILDTEKELCTVNGQVWGITLTSDYFEIEGRVRLWANAPSVVEWEERWL